MSPLELTVPGDKSIAHRALILCALANGDSHVTGLPASADVASTMAMMRAFGAVIEADGERARIRGRGVRGLRAPAQPIDCGNSGTTARLGIGLAAAVGGATTFDGDASLRRRPMERVVEPLRVMGARLDYMGAEGRLPLRVTGAGLSAASIRTDVASAQVKSALLIAGVASGVAITIEEPAPTRDHTERMLRAMGLPVEGDGRGRVSCGVVDAALGPLDLSIPGDISSAAFLLAAALIAEVPIRVRGVGVNPTRTGFLDILRRMGADVALTSAREQGGEPVADLVVAPSSIKSTRVIGAEVVRTIDELPLVAVLAARARGETVVADAAELRAKESDRIRAVCTNLTALGAHAEERADGFAIRGGDGPLVGRVESFGDHRIAMAFAVLGLAKGARIDVDDLDIARISFPGFAARLAHVRRERTNSLGGAA